jgi:hypothetical protein
MSFFSYIFSKNNSEYSFDQSFRHSLFEQDVVCFNNFLSVLFDEYTKIYLNINNIDF